VRPAPPVPEALWQPSRPRPGRSDQCFDRLRLGQPVRAAAQLPAARPGRGALPPRVRRQLPPSDRTQDV